MNSTLDQPEHDVLCGVLSGQPSVAQLDALVDRYCGVAVELMRVANPSLKLPAEIVAYYRTESLASMLRADMIAALSPLYERAEAGMPPKWENRECNQALGHCIEMCMTSRPECVLPLGFDDARFCAEPISDPFLSRDVAGLIDEILEDRNELAIAAGFSTECVDFLAQGYLTLARSTQYRSSDGTWHTFQGVIDSITPSLERASFRQFFAGMAEAWHERVSKETERPHIIGFPALLLPTTYNNETQLHAGTRRILNAIANENRELASLHWRTLEEIVAELLREIGMKVFVTPRSRDGGRDVIARGELIPGEPMLLAVEVKQKAVVPISDLRDSLWANRNYPALLLATSGRFSAGVYRERELNETKLRLLLKDGVALKQWIDDYFAWSLTSGST